MEQFDRPPPPDVPPVELDGIRYSQSYGDSQPPERLESGYLMAEDIESGKLLWRVRIYAPEYDPEEERDIQEIYFTGLSIVEDGAALAVENEAGELWRVDPSTGAATLVRSRPEEPDFDPTEG